MEVSRFARLGVRTAEEAFRAARDAGPGLGFAVDIDLLVQAGPAVVALLDECGPVLVTASLSGGPDRVGPAVHRLVRHGAAWVTIDAASGPETIAAAVAATAGTGCRVAVATVPDHLDDAGTTAIHGVSRGRLVARFARMGGVAGAAAAIGLAADIGVIAGVAPDLGCLVGVRSPEEAADAVQRGAMGLILSNPGLAADLV